MTTDANGKPPLPKTSLKSRLEESIVWVALGCCALGVLGGLTLAKESAILKWISPPAVLPTSSPAGTSERLSNSPVAKRWTDGELIGSYRQTGTSTNQPNCGSCVLEIRKVTNDQIAFETNNGVIGSANLVDGARGQWAGHAQFIPETKGWERTVILVRIRIDGKKVDANFAPVGGGAWDVFYKDIPPQ